MNKSNCPHCGGPAVKAGLTASGSQRVRCKNKACPGKGRPWTPIPKRARKPPLTGITCSECSSSRIIRNGYTPAPHFFPVMKCGDCGKAWPLSTAKNKKPTRVHITPAVRQETKDWLNNQSLSQGRIIDKLVDNQRQGRD